MLSGSHLQVLELLTFKFVVVLLGLWRWLLGLRRCCTQADIPRTTDHLLLRRSCIEWRCWRAWVHYWIGLLARWRQLLPEWRCSYSLGRWSGFLWVTRTPLAQLGDRGQRNHCYLLLFLCALLGRYPLAKRFTGVSIGIELLCLLIVALVALLVMIVLEQFLVTLGSAQWWII